MSEPEALFLDARLHLMDRQVHDLDDIPICVVNDLELKVGEDATPVDPSRHEIAAAETEVAALIDGRSLPTRVFGGRRPYSLRGRIEWSNVQRLGLVLVLKISGESLDQSFGERWLRDHVIGRIPGAHHSAE